MTSDQGHWPLSIPCHQDGCLRIGVYPGTVGYVGSLPDPTGPQPSLLQPLAPWGTQLPGALKTQVSRSLWQLRKALGIWPESRAPRRAGTGGKLWGCGFSRPTWAVFHWERKCLFQRLSFCLWGWSHRLGRQEQLSRLPANSPSPRAHTCTHHAVAATGQCWPGGQSHSSP